jgi:hypothetical protein
MSISKDLRDRPAARRALLAIVLAVAALAANGAWADIIKKEDMLRGIVTTRAQCAATPQAVWVSAYGREFCVRYYLSTAGGEGVRPVVFLQGDYFGKMSPKRIWLDPSDAYDINTDDLMKTADAFSKLSKTTAIYLARIGVEGTSGNHTYRKSVIELHLMNAALDAIKQRHGFEGFHLAGQSGGAMLVAGLSTMRRDVVCAISGSGRLAPSETGKSSDPGRTYFDPVEFIPSIVQNRSLRLFVVTDPADEMVGLKRQTGFVEKIRRAGLHVPQYFVEATDEHHHGVIAYTQLVAAGCILGRSDPEIATAVNTVVKRNAAYNEQRRKETAALAKPATASRRPASDRPTAPAAHSGSSSPRAKTPRGTKA